MKIKVILPFSLRPGSGQPVRDFPVGTHTISEEEHKHWFIKDCLKEGRAVLLQEDPPAGNAGESGEPAAPTKSQLNALNRDALDALAAECGIDVPEGTNKAALIDLLLAGGEGVSLVKGPDGITVQKVA